MVGSVLARDIGVLDQAGSLFGVPNMEMMADDFASE